MTLTLVGTDDGDHTIIVICHTELQHPIRTGSSHHYFIIDSMSGNNAISSVGTEAVDGGMLRYSIVGCNS